MEEHICTVCNMPSWKHDSRCDCGCEETFLLPRCCEGCMCESFEEAHGMDTKLQRLMGRIDKQGRPVEDSQ